MRPLRYSINLTLDGYRVDWNAELVRGDLAKTVQPLKQEPGRGLFTGGVKLPMALAELGLIDESELVGHPRLVGHEPTLFAGNRRLWTWAREPGGIRLRGRGDALRT
jgi:dihydrofolate reductase